jgi:hypothetical protein
MGLYTFSSREDGIHEMHVRDACSRRPRKRSAEFTGFDKKNASYLPLLKSIHADKPLLASSSDQANKAVVHTALGLSLDVTDQKQLGKKMSLFENRESAHTTMLLCHMQLSGIHGFARPYFSLIVHTS